MPANKARLSLNGGESQSTAQDQVGDRGVNDEQEKCIHAHCALLKLLPSLCRWQVSAWMGAVGCLTVKGVKEPCWM